MKRSFRFLYFLSIGVVITHGLDASQRTNAPARRVADNTSVNSYAGTWRGSIPSFPLWGTIDFTFTINPSGTEVTDTNKFFTQTSSPRINGNSVSWHDAAWGSFAWTLTPNADGRTATVKLSNAANLINTSVTFQKGSDGAPSIAQQVSNSSDSKGRKSAGATMTAASPQNPFDGTWNGRLTGSSGEMPYKFDVTLVVSGNLLNSTLTMVDAVEEAYKVPGGGFDHVPWHSRDKLSFDGNTMRTSSIKGDWRLTLSADGRTAVVTADCGFLCNMGRDHWSGTFTRVGAIASSASQVATPATVKPHAVTTKGNQAGAAITLLPSTYNLTLDKAEASLVRNNDEEGTPKGIYAVENQYTFNTLDSVYYDPSKDQLSLVGHLDNRFPKTRIPYLQYLGTLLETRDPRFSLAWTPESEKRVDALFAHQYTQTEGDALMKKWGTPFDAKGNLTRAAQYLLPTLGLSPIGVNGGVPGSIGVEVEQAPKTLFVRVTKLLPNSPAAQAGVQVGDIIDSVNESPPFSPAEFEHFIRMRGASGSLGFHYRRNGKRTYVLIPLVEAENRDVWKGAKEEDIMAAFYFKAGNNVAGQCIRIIGMMQRVQEIYHASDDDVRNLAHGEVFMEDRELLEYLNKINRNGVPPRAQRIEFLRRWNQARDKALDFSGTPVSNAFDQALRRGEGDDAVGAAVGKEFKKQLTLKMEELFNFAFVRPEGIQIAPELIEDEFHVHPEMVPQYFGIDKHSLLAKAMFAGDFIIKRLENRPELKDTIQGYQTAFEFEVKHPESRSPTGKRRTWFSVDKMDTPQSPSGKTLSFRNVKMRFNTRSVTGKSFDDSAEDLPPQPGGYDELLTSLWDNLEVEYPTLHDLKEAAKLAGTAKWISEKNPSAALPREGRVFWKGPDKVPGIILFELTPMNADATRTKRTMIAEGGGSIVPFVWLKGGNPFPSDSSIRDGKEGPITSPSQQLVTINLLSGKAVVAKTDEKAAFSAGEEFDGTGHVTSAGKIQPANIATPPSAADPRISAVPPKYQTNDKVMTYDKEAREWLRKSDQLEAEIVQLERARQTANDGGKTDVELVHKRDEKNTADSQWHTAEIKKVEIEEALDIQESKIKQ